MAAEGGAHEAADGGTGVSVELHHASITGMCCCIAVARLHGDVPRARVLALTPAVQGRSQAGRLSEMGLTFAELFDSIHNIITKNTNSCLAVNPQPFTTTYSDI